MAVIVGDSASYLGVGTHAERIVPTNEAPGTIVRWYETDSRTWWSLVQGSWIQEDLTAPPPPPPPGPSLDQWTCDVAGYITYVVLRTTIKKLVDLVPAGLVARVADIIVYGLIGLILPEDLIIAIPDLITTIATAATSYIVGNVSLFLTWIADDIFWSKVHCKLYDAIHATPGDFKTALLAAAGAIGLITGVPTEVLNAVVLILEHLGITSVAGLPINGFITHYDCSSCVTTGQSGGGPLTTNTFDLVVTDLVTTVPYVETLQFPAGSVSGTLDKATIVFPAPYDLTVSDRTTSVPNVSEIDVTGATVSNLGGGHAGITIPGGTSGIGVVSDPGGTALTGQTSLRFKDALAPFDTVVAHQADIQIFGLRGLGTHGPSGGAGPTYPLLYCIAPLPYSGAWSHAEARGVVAKTNGAPSFLTLAATIATGNIAFTREVIDGTSLTSIASVITIGGALSIGQADNNTYMSVQIEFVAGAFLTNAANAGLLRITTVTLNTLTGAARTWITHAFLASMGGNMFFIPAGDPLLRWLDGDNFSADSGVTIYGSHDNT